MKRLLWIGLGMAALLVLSVGVASADLGDRVLSLGARGVDVEELQQELTEMGYRVPATGYYGSVTRRAVAAFQARAGLPITGKADGPTIQAIGDEIAELAALPDGNNGYGYGSCHGGGWGGFGGMMGSFGGRGMMGWW